MYFFYHFIIDFLPRFPNGWSGGVFALFYHGSGGVVVDGVTSHPEQNLCIFVSGVAITLLIYFCDKCICYMLKQGKLFVFFLYFGGACQFNMQM